MLTYQRLVDVGLVTLKFTDYSNVSCYLINLQEIYIKLVTEYIKINIPFTSL